MSTNNLSNFFQPTSVAVIGASERAGTPGNIVMHNLLAGRFSGPVMPVAPGHRSVAGVLAYPDVQSLPLTPDLAILCGESRDVIPNIRLLGERGAKAALVMSGGVDAAALREAAKPYGLRILGAESMGLSVPSIRLNASIAHLTAKPGQIAFVSQSSAMAATILDWAQPRGIGFSHFVSLGNGADIDFGDMLDYLANDSDARAILLYIESIPERRDFVPAARAAARNKPLLLIKADRGNPNRPIGTFLSETLAASDEVFDAVARRAGALRVEHMDELFAAVETLARNRHMKGERLAVLCNGGGTGLMATDELTLAGGGEVAQLSDALLEKLSSVLPPGRKAGNPIDLGSDAGPDRYANALKILAGNPEVDATLVLHAPTFLANGTEIAQAVISTHRQVGGALLTCWLGEACAEPARRLFSGAGLPTYETLSHAVRGFRHLVSYHRNQDMLLETPPSVLEGGEPDIASARSVIAQALGRADGFLTDPETRSLMAAYKIPVLENTLAATPDEAAEIAEQIGYPVALTYSSPDVPRKWDVGGVALNLENAEAVRSAAEAILRRVPPDKLRFDGLSVQRMALRPNARQLMIGAACDPLFGPVVVFGEGGRAVEVVRDHAIALPPLNRPLARHLISLTRVARRLEAQGIRPAVDLDALADALVRLSRMLTDNPEIVACDINPLFADEKGVLAVDARIRVTPADSSDLRRAAILSYPAELEETASLRDGTPIALRPIRPEDEPTHTDLLRRMSEDDLRYRFFGVVQKFGHHQIARMTQIDYDREMAFIASHEPDNGAEETLGVVRTITDPDNYRTEFAILIRSDLKRTGLGRILMNKIIAYHKTRGTREIWAQVLSDNAGMLGLAKACGFKTKVSAEEPDITECLLILDAKNPAS